LRELCISSSLAQQYYLFFPFFQAEAFILYETDPIKKADVVRLVADNQNLWNQARVLKNEIINTNQLNQAAENAESTGNLPENRKQNNDKKND